MLWWPNLDRIDARRDFENEGDMARGIRELAPRAHAAAMEHVDSRPGQSAQSMWTFARAVARATEAMDASGVPWIGVRPQRWIQSARRTFGVFRQEFNSRDIASRICPPAAVDLFRRIKDHNTADAFLIAHFLWQNIEKEPKSDSARFGSLKNLPPFDELRRLARANERAPGTRR